MVIGQNMKAKMKTILLLLIFASSSLANDFTREAPNGSVYNARTHYYNKNKQRVLIRPEFANLNDADRHALFGMPDVRNNPKWIAAKKEWEEELERRRAIRVVNAQEEAEHRRQNMRQPRIVYRYYPVYYPTYYRTHHNHPVNQMYPNYFSYWGIRVQY